MIWIFHFSEKEYNSIVDFSLRNSLVVEISEFSEAFELLL